MLARLAASPDVYPQKIDLNSLMVLLVQFDADAYRRASFLDDRILTPATVGAWAGVDRVAEASRRVRDARPVHFIFHTGHVGSTLVSRLLDETGIVLSLREPLPLRTLAEAHDASGRTDALLSDEEFSRNTATLMRLWSRGYQATRSVVIKATSSAGRLATTLLSASEVSRAIYLNLRAEPYLATLLAGQNSPTDLRGHGAERMRRLQSRTKSPLAPLHSLSLGDDFLLLCIDIVSELSHFCIEFEFLNFEERSLVPYSFILNVEQARIKAYPECCQREHCWSQHCIERGFEV